MSLFDIGCCEPFKADYHMVLGGLIAGALGYSLVVFVKRPTPQLAVNVVLYTALLAFEQAACARHRKDCL